ALAQLPHPAVVAPLTAVVVGIALIWTMDRRKLLAAYAISVLPTLPAAWIVDRSPVFAETSLRLKLQAFFSTLGVRALIVLIPMALFWLARRPVPAATGPLVFAVLVAANIAMWTPLGMPYAWRG